MIFYPLDSVSISSAFNTLKNVILRKKVELLGISSTLLRFL